MQERHQHRQVAVRGDQLVVHVARVRRGVAQPQQAGQLRQLAQQPAEAPGAAVRRLAVPGVDVLPEQRDLARALRHQPPRLGDHRRRRAARLGAARVGHDAEAAELVAALLDGQEGGDALRRGRVGQEVELVLGREIGLDHRAAGPRRPRHHLRQPVIGLRPQHDVDVGRARQDLGALGLRHAAGDGQDHASAVRRAPLLQPAQPAELGEHLLRRLVADMAGVEDHHVGAVRHRRPARSRAAPAHRPSARCHTRSSGSPR